jgi:hypothetical protein
MPRARYEPTTPVFERAKTDHSLGSAASVIVMKNVSLLEILFGQFDSLKGYRILFFCHYFTKATITCSTNIGDSFARATAVEDVQSGSAV